jgi:hypothetical protein
MPAKNVHSLLSRRRFLAGSAALAASTRLFALDVDWAAPRGRERSLLAGACSPERLKQALITQDRYRPFPTIRDRSAWEGLRPETRSAFLIGGEKYLDYKWPDMQATVFLQYARNGNRTGYESLRNARMRALQALLFAECVENKGRFLDDITNGIWAAGAHRHGPGDVSEEEL